MITVTKDTKVKTAVPVAEATNAFQDKTAIDAGTAFSTQKDEEKKEDMLRMTKS